MGTVDIRSALKKAEQEGDFFNDFAVEVAERTYQMRPSPVLQIGATGWGKTKLARFLASLADLEFVGVKAYPGMDISQLIGMWRPKNSNGNIEVAWEDGLLTQAIRKGALFALEEITRLPRKMQGRLLGVLDSENRYYSLPEAGISNIEVNEDFWLVATANPTGGGYDTSSLDRALTRRFGAIFNVNQPLCDETRKFEYELRKYYDEEFAVNRAKSMVKWATDLRQADKVSINTGEVVQLIHNSSFAPIKDACLWTIAPKYNDSDVNKIMTNLDAQFHNEDDWEKHRIDTPTEIAVANGSTTKVAPTIEERKNSVTTDDLTSMFASMMQKLEDKKDSGDE